MSVTVNPVFGSFDYETGGGSYPSGGVTVEEWRDEPSHSRPVSAVPRSHITRAVDNFLRERQISIRGVIGPDGGGTREDLRLIEDAFKEAHRPGFRTLQRDTDRYIMAQVQSATWGEDNGNAWYPFALQFACADPYWYATAPDPVNAWSSPTSGSTHTLTNSGSATALPVFTITVGSSGTLGLTLTNTSLSPIDSFSLSGSVSAGDVFVVDCSAQTVTLNGSNRMSYLSGDFPVLNPGTNVLQLQISGVTLATIATVWTRRWL